MRVQELRDDLAGRGGKREIIGDCYGGEKKRPLLVMSEAAYTPVSHHCFRVST